MGWFESQIRERQRCDETLLQDALRELASAITGQRNAASADALKRANDAIAEVLGYYGARPTTPPRKMTEVRDLLEFQLAPTGIMFREVRLTKGWQKDAVGAFLGFLEDGTPVALLPQEVGYAYKDHVTGLKVHVDAKVAAGMQERAFCFYRPFPLRKLNLLDILVFLVQVLDRKDYLRIALSSLAVTLLGLLLPAVNTIVFGPAVSASDVGIIGPVAVLLLGTSFAQVLISTAKSYAMAGVGQKLSIAVESATMMRVLSLPPSFFKQYTAGELASRISSVKSIASTLQSALLGSVLTALFSLVYLGQIFAITPSLIVPAFIIIVVSAAVSLGAALLQTRVSRQQLQEIARLSGWVYALLGGVQKIRLAGAETRAFTTWVDHYVPQARLTYSGPLLVRLSGTIQTLVSLAGTIVIYASAIAGGVSVADYMAYTVAFGMVSGAFSSLTSAAVSLASVKPHWETASSILKTVPETGERRAVVTHVSGAFELDNVTFSYGEGTPPIFDGLSLKIKQGSYVAVVGKTGCGKSTLMRLLLGFETPQKGAIYFDGKDISTLDMPSLRRHIGVVLQDGKLFAGDVYSNITVSAPWITREEAWEVAELAGIADDIRAMPMGMNTMVSEGGSGGLSGGQRQRLMIARALAPRPKILMFDEATSALDNVTQRIVTESLDSLKCTRIVIAHRLSTIRACDRIVVIDGGRIVEDGTYDELTALGGVFSDLVRRQQV